MTVLVPGNRITLLTNGSEYFPALEAAIDSADREIYLESYIFAADATGDRIARSLIRAVRRGVATHLLLDGFGSQSMPSSWVADLERDGASVLFFRREISPWTFQRSRLRRLHRKLAVIDGRIAFVGGINIIDDMDTPGQIPPRYDYAVAVEGPVVSDVLRATRRLWNLVAWYQWRRRSRWHRGESHAAPLQGGVAAALLTRDNIRHRRDIEEAYLQAIGQARREIFIANAYFLPGLDFRHALIDAARRGVRVVLLLQGRVEYRLLHYASRALYGVLLDAGVEIHEYHRSFLHAKVAVIDGRWATVGSSNIDPFSLMLAREANVVVDDQGFARQLRDSLENAKQIGSTLLLAESWKLKSPWSRVLSWAAYGVVRFLMGVSGYGRRYRWSEAAVKR
ncbi:MAG: cardiolipin synthase ClsB [Sulfuricellaceae bacterium]|nr:cardiolipin synthase ClsB [Sulfuricellaceae bacterium]